VGVVTNLTPAWARAELDGLTARVEETREAYRRATDAVQRAWETARDVAADLAEHHHRVLTRQAHNTDPDVPRRLTLAVLRRIEDEELLLEPFDPARPAAGLKIVNPWPVRAQMEAHDEATAARAALDSFAQECRALLEEDTAREQVARVRTALDDSDPAELRDALAALPQADPRSAALTTDDLAPGGLR